MACARRASAVDKLDCCGNHFKLALLPPFRRFPSPLAQPAVHEDPRSFVETLLAALRHPAENHHIDVTDLFFGFLAGPNPMGHGERKLADRLSCGSVAKVGFSCQVP